MFRHLPRHDVAIYAPEAAGLYERLPRETGGAEVQTALLATSLVEQGMRAAHIVFPLHDPAPQRNGGPSVVQREAYAGDFRPASLALEGLRVWRSLEAADASTYVFRMGSPVLGIVAAFCRRRGRSLVFAAANDFDFTFERLGGLLLPLYKWGIRHTDAVVVQTAEQTRLARVAFAGLRPVEIPSFAEPAEPAVGLPKTFLWAARLVDYKQPLRYLDLAEVLPEARFQMIAMETGETPPELSAEVRSRAAELDNLELLGPRARRETLPLLDSVVAVVSTSRREGMPNVFLEGWARGVPALSLDFDPDGRIASAGLGASAEGDFEGFVAAAWEMWETRQQRPWSARTRAYIDETHSLAAVGERWNRMITEARGP